MPVLGICNGFQVLTETGLLPGALMRNAGIRFICRDVGLRVENSQSAFTACYETGEEIVLPVAHHDGNYQADAATLDRLEGEGRVALRYTGEVNGSARNIAGVLNAAGNVLGMMPHPERALEPAHGRTMAGGVWGGGGGAGASPIARGPHPPPPGWRAIATRPPPVVQAGLAWPPPPSWLPHHS